MDCEIVDGLTRDGIVISSSHIRTLILAGDVAGANELLGYPFTLTGPVLHGKKLGRTLGAPTINQRFHEGSITPRHRHRRHRQERPCRVGRGPAHPL